MNFNILCKNCFLLAPFTLSKWETPRYILNSKHELHFLISIFSYLVSVGQDSQFPITSNWLPFWHWLFQFHQDNDCCFCWLLIDILSFQTSFFLLKALLILPRVECGVCLIADYWILVKLVCTVQSKTYRNVSITRWSRAFNPDSPVHFGPA